MPHKRGPRRPNCVPEPADLRPVNRPQANVARTALPPPDKAHATTSAEDENVHTYSLQGYDRTYHPRALHHPPGIDARIDTPPSATTTSFNWWPFPPWGQSTSTVSGTSSEIATLSAPPVAMVSVDPPTSTTIPPA